MQKKDTSTTLKENIITSAMDLIQNSNGNIAEITTRAIAENANVGIGLINYHFQSKENLITICVQKIISSVVYAFQPDGKVYANDAARLTDWAVQVFNFLFENSAISRISILGDMADYSSGCNSVSTQKGFLHALSETIEDGTVEKSDAVMLAFILTSAMQTAFLGSKTCHELLGYDFNRKEERHQFITNLVSALYDGLLKKHS